MPKTLTVRRSQRALIFREPDASQLACVVKPTHQIAERPDRAHAIAELVLQADGDGVFAVDNLALPLDDDLGGVAHAPVLALACYNGAHRYDMPSLGTTLSYCRAGNGRKQAGMVGNHTGFRCR